MRKINVNHNNKMAQITMILVTSKITFKIMTFLTSKIKKYKIYTSPKLNSISKRESRKNSQEALHSINQINR